MRNKKSSPSQRTRRSTSSPGRPRPVDSAGLVTTDPNPVLNPRSSSRTAASLLDAPLLIDDVEDRLDQYTGSNPRSFPYSVKQRCWEKAEKVKGRDPDRWRRDPLGNLVFRKLVGCPGCLCHDYDHILPYSKGGKSTLENCQVLQATVNRSKGNKTEVSRSELIQKSAYCKVSGRDMDLLEISAFGNIRRGQEPGGCNETAQSTESPQSCCNPQDCAKLCDMKTCFACNSMREAQAQTIRGTILIPCRTAMKGSFPLNGTYFQVNEVFADHSSSCMPIDVPRKWIWNLPRRTVFFGTSIPTIFKGLTMEGIQHCFWRGFVCVRGFDRASRAPRPLYARLHIPASKALRNKKTAGNEQGRSTPPTA